MVAPRKTPRPAKTGGNGRSVERCLRMLGRCRPSSCCEKEPANSQLTRVIRFAWVDYTLNPIRVT